MRIGAAVDVYAFGVMLLRSALGACYDEVRAARRATRLFVLWRRVCVRSFSTLGTHRL